jgi:hypothetical protein
VKRVLFLIVGTIVPGCLTGAFASLLDEGFVTFTGTGLGAVPTILTVQSPGNSTAAGGNEMMGSSRTLTQPVSAALPLNGFAGPITSYGQLVLVVNANQPGGTPVNLTRLTMTAYSPAGAALGSVSADCPTGGCVLSPTTPGLGNSDYAFQVSADEVATLGSFGTANRIGVAATFTGATGGPESIFLGAGPALGGGGGGGVAGGGAVPESDTAVLLGGGLIAFAVALKWRNGKRVPRARSQRSWGL